MFHKVLRVGGAAKSVAVSSLIAFFVLQPLLTVKAAEASAIGTANQASSPVSESAPQVSNTIGESLPQPTIDKDWLNQPLLGDAQAKEKVSSDNSELKAKDIASEKGVAEPEASAKALSGGVQALSGGGGYGLDPYYPAFKPDTSAQGNSQKKPEVDESSGSLSYALPINLPQGRNGVQPNLALTYSSQDRDITENIIGLGWNLSTPFISRFSVSGTQELYQKDAFRSSLDGELVKTASGTYAARIERGGFLDYRYDGTVWTAKTKTGLVYTFGNASDARQFDSVTTTHVSRWMLTEIRDANDNYATFTYTKDQEQIYPDTISYTHGNGVAGIYTVYFDKEARPVDTSTYAPGFLVKTHYRISAVRVLVQGVERYRVSLGYVTGDNGANSLLSTFTESGVDALGVTTTLPAMKFEYDRRMTSAFQSAPRNPTTIGLGAQMADVNGDGLPDRVISSINTNPTTLKKVNSSSVQMNVLLVTPSVGTRYFDWVASTTWSIPSGFEFNSDNNDMGARLADMNADGKADFLSKDKGIWYNNGTSTWYNSGIQVPVAFSATGPVYGGRYSNGTYLADLNKDGLTDIVKNSVTYLNTGSGFVSTTNWALPSLPFFAWPRDRDNYYVSFPDINGDGISDLVWQHAIRAFEDDNGSGGSSNYGPYTAVTSTQRVFINTGYGWNEVASTTVPVMLGTGMYYPTASSSLLELNSVRLVDINSDGLQDVVRGYHKGRMDMSCGRQWVGSESQLAYLNTGNGFVTTTIPGLMPLHKLQLVNIGAGSCLHYHNFFKDLNGYVMDVDGDLKNDSINEEGISQNGTVAEIGKGDLLSKIIYPQGGSVTITYSASAQLFYDDTSTRFSYNPVLPLNQRVVGSIQLNDVLGPSATTAYEYRNGVMKKDPSRPSSASFAGFETVIRKDPAKTIISYYHQGNAVSSTLGEVSDSFARSGLPYKTVLASTTGAIFDVVFTAYAEQSLASASGEASRYSILVSTTTKQFYEGGSTHRDIAEVRNYDSVGNIISNIDLGEVSSSNNGTFTDVGSDSRQSSYEYAVFATSGATSSYPYRVTESGLGSEDKISEIIYDNNSLGVVSSGQPTRETMRNASSSVSVSTKKSYDTTGLLESYVDGRGNTTTFANDGVKMYVVTTTNPLGHTVVAEYDYALSSPWRITDANGQKKRVQYDGVGRAKATYGPDSQGTEVQYTSTTYIDTLPNVRVLTGDVFDASNTAFTVNFLDGFGRTQQTRSATTTGASIAIVSDTTFDGSGRVVSSSLPYFNNGFSRTIRAGTTIVNVYDPKDRIRSQTHYSRIKNNYYSPFATDIKDERGKLKRINYDAYGRITSVVERNLNVSSTTQYTYGRDGELKTITDPAGNVRSFTYDVLGRRLTAEDLHAPGDVTYQTRSYTYDQNGNLLSEQRNDGSSLSYSYDALNRPITSYQNGSSTNEFSYDACTLGVGRSCGESGQGYSRVYAYDGSGNRTHLGLSTATTTYNEYAEYDRQGRVTSSTLSDGSRIGYTYKGDKLIQINATEVGTGTKLLVKGIKYAVNGEPGEIVYGNGATTTNTYESNNFYRKSSTVTSFNATTVQSLVYSYDLAGNITAYRDTSNAIGRRNVLYTYDDLGRLTYANATSQTGAALIFREYFNYDALGNIVSSTQKIGVGPTTTKTYIYGGIGYANPHAVTSVSSTASGTYVGFQTYAYDQRGNMTEMKVYDASSTEIGANRRVSQYDIADKMLSVVLGVTSATTYGYNYNADGMRLSQSNGSLFTDYVSPSYNVAYDASGVATSVQKHVGALGKNVVSIDGSGVAARALYQHLDHLSGANVITNDAQTIEEFVDYYSYGGVRVDSKAGNWSEQRKFTGHENDATGLIYMKARYQDPNLGRFASQDPVFWDLSVDLADPQGWNSYAYARNNPIVFVDPDGKAFVSSFGAGAYSNGASIGGWLSQGPIVTIRDTSVGILMSPVNFAKDIYFSDNYKSGVTNSVASVQSMSSEQRTDAAGYVLGGLATQAAFSAAVGGAVGGLRLVDGASTAVVIKEPYSRPPNAVTNAQRKSVNAGDPACHTCGAKGVKMVADHSRVLVQEYYETGTINMSHARSLAAVKPQCQNCSASQGAAMSKYSKEMKDYYFGKK